MAAPCVCGTPKHSPQIENPKTTDLASVLRLHPFPIQHPDADSDIRVLAITRKRHQPSLACAVRLGPERERFSGFPDDQLPEQMALVLERAQGKAPPASLGSKMVWPTSQLAARPTPGRTRDRSAANKMNFTRCLTYSIRVASVWLLGLLDPVPAFTDRLPQTSGEHLVDPPPVHIDHLEPPAQGFSGLARFRKVVQLPNH